MLALAQRLPRDRFAVDFVVLTGPGEYDDRARAAGATIQYVGSTPQGSASSGWSVGRRGGKLLRYAQVARRRRYDIVDAWLYPSDALAALLRPLTGPAVIIGGRRNVDPQERFGPLERPVALIAGRLTDAVVANSHQAARHAITNDRVDPRKVRVIHNGVEPIPDTADAVRRALRHELAIADGDIAIGCIANLLPVKRHDLLLEAFADALRSGPGARLVLVGDGPLRPMLERQIRGLGLGERVRLHGSVPDARRIIPAFDVVVQASDREGLPNALLEAAAGGRPIVATDAGGTREIIPDETTGLLVPVGNAGALAGAIRRLMGDVGLRQRLGRAARVHAEGAFGMDRFVNQFASLYEELAVAKGVRR
jgi:glycosyltransferase involved in cell wall biosynthesis